MAEMMKVLVAEDNKELCAQAAAALRGYGYETISAPRDGAKVVEMILAQNPAVAVIDVVMPHLDALGVMKAVHDRAPQNKTQFMVTINYENGVVERELLAAGAVYYFLRPFDIEVLAERIVQFSGRKRGDNVTRITDARRGPGLEVVITDIIHQIGVPAHIKGASRILCKRTDVVQIEQIISREPFTFGGRSLGVILVAEMPRVKDQPLNPASCRKRKLRVERGSRSSPGVCRSISL